jgi:N-acetylmuramoyl-L-alanine amidase
LQRFAPRLVVTQTAGMRFRLFLLITIVGGVLLAAPAAASAYFVHVVAPGESLSSIAAADGVSVDQLAAANGLSSNAELITGSGVQIPPQGSSVAAAAPASTIAGASATSGAGNAVDPDNDGDVDNPGPETASASTGSTASQGVYVVQPGDTLSAIAAREGVSVDQLAAANGLDPNAYLLYGTVLRPVGSSGSSGPVYVSQTTSSSTAASQPVGAAAQGVPTDPPYPTPERVTAPEVSSIASANGVPGSLADAIAWQESGFNNDLVSSADARGVMQILPGTWQYIQSSLNPTPPLAPASAADNVRGGVLLLHSLLTATGDDPSLAAAGYYQGLPSVQQNGEYPSTQQYVQDVLSLRQQFGGG